MKHVFWLEPVKRDGVWQARPRKVTVERAIQAVRDLRPKRRITDQEALDWFLKQKKGRLVK